ncbi:TPA: MarR family transcriptional regulator [Vibrio parahaemolyticus]|uniref:MarR family winged helix-turn-helix transcriptional regulator n=1 Tax=Vibrio parahaemolyticus TaxID=670 RepID=UPI00112103DE|nr:MarR family transcriptional regulator [Vibrio parahaemolyticus]ELB2182843.1 MarR family transcriptional regulator [Vibrio parahaemolyticus]MCC3843262.1 MarR family transcriptional regulator [Vibrio parahaemolyticus]TOJ21032.1 MarR family transcriptional regulator [Vibrio parahaemolyticus]HAS6865495.1 MarR family transcriptional regulator [Vibrio parahaemolyticus]HAV1513632.1 MarR family transcriptional regulator [Vibrio parahaemolyticus]
MSQCYSPSTLNADEQLLLENQVCFPLYSAANAVIRAYRPLLDALDLTYSQYLVMMVLWEKDGTSVKELGSQLHLDSGTLTPLLKRLEAKGFVSRGRSETDERVRVLNLTEAGRALKDQAKSVPDAIACKFTLDLEELVTLKTLCEKVLDKLS